MKKYLFLFIVAVAMMGQARADFDAGIAKYPQNPSTSSDESALERLHDEKVKDCQRNSSDTQQALRKCLFHVGNMHKARIKDCRGAQKNLVPVSSGSVVVVSPGVSEEGMEVKEAVEVNMTGDDATVVIEAPENKETSLIDPANADGERRADGSGMRNAFMGAN